MSVPNNNPAFPAPQRAPGQGPEFGQGQPPAGIPGGQPAGNAGVQVPAGLTSKRMIPIPGGMSEVSASSAVPAGQYAAILENIEESVSKAGNPMLVFQFKIVDENSNGRKLTSNVAIQENTMWKLREHFDALAVDVNQPQFDSDKVKNTLVVLSVATKEYDGRETNDIRQVRAWEPPGTKYNPSQLPTG